MRNLGGKTQAWYPILHCTSPFRCFSDHMFMDSTYFPRIFRSISAYFPPILDLPPLHSDGWIWSRFCQVNNSANQVFFSGAIQSAYKEKFLKGKSFPPRWKPKLPPLLSAAPPHRIWSFQTNLQKAGKKDQGGEGREWDTSDRTKSCDSIIIGGAHIDCCFVETMLYVGCAT